MLSKLVRAGLLLGFVVTAVAQSKGPIVRLTATSDNVSGAGDTIKIDLLSWSTDADRDQLVSAWMLTAPAAGAGGGGGRGGAGRGGGGGAGAAAGRGGGARGGGGGAAAANAGGNAAAPAANGAAAANADGAAPAAAAAAGARGGGGQRGGGGGGGRGGGGGAPAAPETPESSLAAAVQKASTVGILWTSESAGYSIHYAYRIPQPDGGQRIILVTDRRLGGWNNSWKPAGGATPTNYDFTLIEIHLNARGEGEGKATLSGKVAVDQTAKTIALDGYASQPIVLKGVKRTSGS